ncbi:MAG: ketopantoate reductase family protein [Acidobacteriota bacterium]
MKIAVLGAGAMGSVFGARLARAGQDVTLIDVRRDTVEAVNAGGLQLKNSSGEIESISLRATTEPRDVGPVDLIMVFVKCYHTHAAVCGALPLIASNTAILTLQNGWGNIARIAEIIDQKRVLAGVTYHSATLLGPGHVHHAGQGMTIMGELDGRMSGRLSRIVDAFQSAGLEVTPTAGVVQAIWSKLALNVCTLPTSALLRFYAGRLGEHAGTIDLMRELLRETVGVANRQNIPLDYDERWEAITGMLKRAGEAKSSMFQDIENRRRTEIDAVNGAVVEAGRRLDFPTPYNEAMFWLVRSLEETF